jgi:hypothetical protein
MPYESPPMRQPRWPIACPAAAAGAATSSTTRSGSPRRRAKTARARRPPIRPHDLRLDSSTATLPLREPHCGRGSSDEDEAVPAHRDPDEGDSNGIDVDREGHGTSYSGWAERRDAPSRSVAIAAVAGQRGRQYGDERGEQTTERARCRAGLAV